MNGRKVKLKKNKIRWFIALFAMFICAVGYSQKTDTLKIKNDSLKAKTDTLHLRTSKDSLDAPVTYIATDSIVMEMPTKRVILYNEANTKYKDMDMKAYKIEVDQPKRIVVATYKLDTAGKMIGQPKFVQGENKMQADSITYNIDTKKGITRSTFTNQGDLFIHGEKIKKISDDSYFAFKGRFTTCNLDTPHFAFVANKLKLINKKVAISGPVHPEFEGVPIPIYIPFGFFPINQGRHSGLLPPTFTTNEQFGLGLEGLGYYKVLNENFDATIRTNLYSYGGYMVNLSSKYIKRYHYSGNLTLSYNSVRILNDAIGSPETFTTSKVFNIGWSHSMDSKARPGVTFSANVNAGSTKYNQYIPNSPALNFTNQLSSSIAYSKTWTGLGGNYNFTANANHSQNSTTRLINLSLPMLTFSAPTIYIFQPRELTGQPKWYQKLGIGLNSTLSSQGAFYDSAFNFKKLLDTFQVGAQHSIPITLSLPQLGFLQVTPGVSLQQRWYDRRMYRTWNSVNKKVDTAIFRGFYTANNMSYSLGLSTAIFGTFQNFGKSSSLLGIRHVIRPTVSLSYSPDLNGKDHYYLQTDSTGYKQRVSFYDGAVNGPYGEGKFGGMSFGLDNHIEIKVRSKTDTSSAGIKKITIIDGFGFNGSYNYLADSMRLSPISFYLRSTLFQKINISGGATLDPYQVDSLGRDSKYYAWQQGRRFSPGKITSYNLAISTSLQSKSKDPKKTTTQNQNQQSNQIPLTTEEEQNELNYIRTHPAEFADFNIPWSLNLSFSLNYTKVAQPNYTYINTLTSGLNLSGDFNLTPKWKMGMQTYYDVRYSKIQSLTMNLSRDMHCWQMAISVTPYGLYKSFSITLNPKSGILRDLRINRSRSFYGGQ